MCHHTHVAAHAAPLSLQVPTKEQFSEFLAFYAVMRSNKEELKWRASFALSDTNHNGKLNAKELETAMTRAFMLNSVRQASTPPTATTNILPINASAVPSRPYTESEKHMIELQVQQFIRVADKDRNGDITLAEYLNALRRCGPLFENVAAFSFA